MTGKGGYSVPRDMAMYKIQMAVEESETLLFGKHIRKIDGGVDAFQM